MTARIRLFAFHGNHHKADKKALKIRSVNTISYDRDRINKRLAPSWMEGQAVFLFNLFTCDDGGVLRGDRRAGLHGVRRNHRRI